eukprot:CAMPEP_0181189170 /NCGR_PEP_ID=MMETSP1096-20121128/11520_1 /TAXON_ID=156174 ORGANISM="Chrysochromulina ericina, Strain CCMP281" /NCGR_SAMPLE_ID=MMETSP1096 /ASSEMBLY_ACC=CAM_ASM_000453 /LENGTH=79 /DNA_ID=CAMNT_0023278307 /DNA_START=199 /DNA_END=434 /DNA_ORIENTATION=+
MEIRILLEATSVTRRGQWGGRDVQCRTLIRNNGLRGPIKTSSTKEVLVQPFSLNRKLEGAVLVPNHLSFSQHIGLAPLE